MYELMEILFCAIDVGFLDQFIRFFLEEKRNTKRYYKLIAMVILTLAIHFVTGFKAFSSHTTLVSMTLMCIYTISMYRGQIQNKIIVGIVFEIFLGLCTITGLNLIAYMVDQEISMLLAYGNFKRIIVVLMVKMIILVVLLGAKRTLNLTKVEMPKGYRSIILAIFIASFLTVIIMFKLSVYNTDATLYRMITILAVVFFAFNIIIYGLFRKVITNMQETAKTDLILHNQDVMREHIMELNKSHKEIRKIKHDMFNHYGIIEYMLTNNQSEECIKYIKELRSRAENVPMYYTTGNVIGDAVINQKLYSTREENIKYDLQIKFPNEMKIDEVDLGTLLVNLIDNAIEAVREVETEERKIKINIHPHHNKLLINIVNTVASNPIQDNKLIRRKKANKYEHGYGLLNIKYVVNKYEGYMEYSCKKNVFEVNILLDYAETEGIIDNKITI